NTDSIFSTLMPLASSGIRICDCCWWRCAFGSVLPITIAILQRGSPTPEDHHLRPLITYSLPSLRIDVSMLVASEEAPAGSVIRNAERISPAIKGRSHLSFCSFEP